MRSPGKTITLAAAFAAAGLILGYIETIFILPVNIPGFRIGLANIVSVLSLYMLGGYYASFIVILRVVTGSVLFGTPVSFAYSICGAVLSLAVMTLLRRTGLSVYGVSVAGAVSHNIAQILVALVFVRNVYILSYIPVLIIIGVLSGLIVGLVSDIIYKRLRKISAFDPEEL